MKVSKTALIFLGVGIFVILVAILGMTYSQQTQEQSRLNQELSLAQLRLKEYASQQLSSQQAELESQLTQLEARLEVVKAGLYQSIQSIEATETLYEVTETLYEVAETSEVEIVEISSPGLTTEELEGVTLSVLSLAVTVEGDVRDLIDFIDAWTEKYPTGVVELVEITVLEATDEETEEEETEEEEEEEKFSAIVNLLIYTYEGN